MQGTTKQLIELYKMSDNVAVVSGAGISSDIFNVSLLFYLDI